jgi:hypothetical protein
MVGRKTRGANKNRGVRTGERVIASEAKQSRAAGDNREAVLDCFVASLLAMTKITFPRARGEGAASGARTKEFVMRHNAPNHTGTRALARGCAGRFLHVRFFLESIAAAGRSAAAGAALFSWRTSGLAARDAHRIAGRPRLMLSDH